MKMLIVDYFEAVEYDSRSHQLPSEIIEHDTTICRIVIQRRRKSYQIEAENINIGRGDINYTTVNMSFGFVQYQNGVDPSIVE